MRTGFTSAGVAVLCLTLPTTAVARHRPSVVGTEASIAKHWGYDERRAEKHWKHQNHKKDDRRAAVRRFFPAHDMRVIREYYAPEYRTLPPGLQKKLYRTGRLPPGWQKKLQPFPVAIERQLVVLPGGYRRGVIDAAAIVYDPVAGVIIDIAPLFAQR
jgi:hypothetical protein